MTTTTMMLAHSRARRLPGGPRLCLRRPHPRLRLRLLGGTRSVGGSPEGKARAAVGDRRLLIIVLTSLLFLSPLVSLFSLPSANTYTHTQTPSYTRTLLSVLSPPLYFLRSLHSLYIAPKRSPGGREAAAPAADTAPASAAARALDEVSPRRPSPSACLCLCLRLGEGKEVETGDGKGPLAPSSSPSSPSPLFSTCLDVFFCSCGLLLKAHKFFIFTVSHLLHSRVSHGRGSRARLILRLPRRRSSVQRSRTRRVRARELFRGYAVSPLGLFSARLTFSPTPTLVSPSFVVQRKRLGRRTAAPPCALTVHSTSNPSRRRAETSG